MVGKIMYHRKSQRPTSLEQNDATVTLFSFTSSKLHLNFIPVLIPPIILSYPVQTTIFGKLFSQNWSHGDYAIKPILTRIERASWVLIKLLRQIFFDKTFEQNSLTSLKVKMRLLILVLFFCCGLPYVRIATLQFECIL